MRIAYENMNQHPNNQDQNDINHHMAEMEIDEEYKMTRCLLIASKMVKGIIWRLAIFNFALSDSNKSFEDDRTKTVGTFPQFFESAPRASDERSKEWTDPKHCQKSFYLSEPEIEQSWSLGWAAVLATVASASLRASDERTEKGEYLRLTRSLFSFIISYWLINS